MGPEFDSRGVTDVTKPIREGQYLAVPSNRFENDQHHRLYTVKYLKDNDPVMMEARENQIKLIKEQVSSNM